MSRLFATLCVCIALTSPSAAATESLPPLWVQLGTVENPAAQLQFVVHREVGGTQHYILTVHELVAVSKADNGEITRAYRDEPCLLWVDENHDGIFTPNERRWKMPNDHVCPAALLPGYVSLRVDGATKTITLTWHVPTGRRKPDIVTSLSAGNVLPKTVLHTQLPELP